MKKLKKILGFVLSLIIIFSFSSCVNSNEKVEEIRNTFNSFENSDNYIFKTYNQLHIGKRVISLEDIKYNGEKCELIKLEKDGAYAYCYEISENESSESQVEENYAVNLLYVNYLDLGVEFIDKIELPKKINSVYFKANDIIFLFGFKNEESSMDAEYLIYNIETKQVSEIPSQEISQSDFFTADKNRSEKYVIEHYNNDITTILTGNRLKITDKESGEVRILDESILYTCEEGTKILEFGELNCGGFGCAYEKDGEIFVSSIYLTDGLLGELCHVFIVKYNFDSHTVEFHTSVELSVYPEHIDDMYIP